MSPFIARHCDQCKQYVKLPIYENTCLICSQCQSNWGKVTTLNQIFEHCPICRCRQFYLSKDFNQFLGCLILLIGIVLVPFTFGLSLPLFAFIDWLLHKRTKTIINCYRCGSEFRDLTTDKNFKPFLHHIGLKYDKYR